MKKAARPNLWVIEFDYNADPDTSEQEVRAAVQDELSLSPTAAFSEDIVVVDTLGDALRVKMRVNENIIGIYPQSA